MTLDKRSTAILMQLIHANDYLSMKELEERLNVSRRTIYYDIDKINHWLENQGIEKVHQVRSAGFILSEDAKASIPNQFSGMEMWHYEYSAKERKAWIAIYLLLSPTESFLDDLMEKTRVSRNTTIEDIKSLRQDLRQFDLILDFDRKHGYVVLGKEIESRRAAIYYLSLIVAEQNLDALQAAINVQQGQLELNQQLFQQSTLQKIYDFIAESEIQLRLQFTDDMLYSLTLRLIVISKRIARDQLIELDAEEKEVLRETKAFKVAKQLCEKLELLYQITFPEEEQFYVTTHLLGARVNYSKEDLKDASLSTQLSQVAKVMVDNFQKYACVLFKDQEALVENLLLHLKPAYYRVKYDMELDNSMIDLVRTNYEEIFMLTKRVISPFEMIVGKPIPEKEIAFISIHFGGWLLREGAAPIAQKRALIVCATGIGTSQILRQQLEGLFSTIDITDTVSVREYEENDYAIDLVISTTSVLKKKHPTFVVNPILTDIEKESLLKSVNALFNDFQKPPISLEGLMNVIERHVTVPDKKKLMQDLKLFITRPEVSLQEGYKPNLWELLTIDTIQVKDEVSDWKQAIAYASRPLLEQQAINDGYVEQMIENVEKYGPYIVVSPKIAIPHAKPDDGAYQLGISLLKLNQPVAFSGQSKHQVNFIVVLATLDNEAHLKALSQLVEIFSTKHTLEILLETSTAQEINSFIRQSLR